MKRRRPDDEDHMVIDLTSEDAPELTSFSFEELIGDAQYEILERTTPLARALLAFTSKTNWIKYQKYVKCTESLLVLAAREDGRYSFFATLKREFMTPYLGDPQFLLAAAIETNNITLINDLVQHEPFLVPYFQRSEPAKFDIGKKSIGPFASHATFQCVNTFLQYDPNDSYIFKAAFITGNINFLREAFPEHVQLGCNGDRTLMNNLRRVHITDAFSSGNIEVVEFLLKATGRNKSALKGSTYYAADKIHRLSKPFLQYLEANGVTLVFSQWFFVKAIELRDFELFNYLKEKFPNQRIYLSTILLGYTSADCLAIFNHAMTITEIDTPSYYQLTEYKLVAYQLIIAKQLISSELLAITINENQMKYRSMKPEIINFLHETLDIQFQPVGRIRSAISYDQPSAMHLDAIRASHHYFSDNHGKSMLCRSNANKLIPLLLESKILNLEDFITFVANDDHSMYNTTYTSVSGGMRQLVAMLRYLLSPGSTHRLDAEEILFNLCATHFKYQSKSDESYGAYLLDHIVELLLNARHWTVRELERIRLLSFKSDMPKRCQQRIKDELDVVRRQ